MNNKTLEDIARKMRIKILDISYSCKLSAHIGGALSMVDIMAVLYTKILRYDLNNPNSESRDKFILSKGHGALGYYSALLIAGLISEEKYLSFQTNESDLTAHPVMNIDLGIESSNGSLGHGLSMAVGLALASKKKQKNNKIYTLLGNGECNEGSVWEAVMSAVRFNLGNLTAIVDNNGYQNEMEPSKKIMETGNFIQQWESFGWNVISVDGHNLSELLEAFLDNRIVTKPKVIIANTIKGRGVSFMENNNEWHHNRLTELNYTKAIKELEVQ